MYVTLQTYWRLDPATSVIYRDGDSTHHLRDPYVTLPVLGTVSLQAQESTIICTKPRFWKFGLSILFNLITHFFDHCDTVVTEQLWCLKVFFFTSSRSNILLSTREVCVCFWFLNLQNSIWSLCVVGCQHYETSLFSEWSFLCVECMLQQLCAWK